MEHGGEKGWEGMEGRNKEGGGREGGTEVGS